MNRRNALKHAALAVGSFAALPAWASRWQVRDLPTHITDQPNPVLNELIDTLIPKTDTPGAAELGVPQFVWVMVNDCTPDKDKSTFISQLNQVDAFAKKNYGKSFSKLSTTEKTACLTAMENNPDAAWQSFFGTLKRYTVQGYMTSEYVMTQQGYQFVPGHYEGCVPL